MIAVLSDFESPRLRYVCETIFEEWLNRPFIIVTTPDDLPEESVTVEYGVDYPGAALTIPEEGLLRESDLRSKMPEVVERKGLPKIFVSENSPSDSDFDLFSAVFFCLSRYEEYLPCDRDLHGRFRASQSIFRDYITAPYLDRWVLDLERRLFPSSRIPRKLRWINTMDVDIAFAYKGRSFGRLLGGIAKDFLKGRWDRISERSKTLSEKIRDPFDTFDDFYSDEAYSNLVFYQAGGNSKYDLSLGSTHQEIKKLFRRLTGRFEIGIHPSYESQNSLYLIEKESNELQTLMGKEVVLSRQHFLRMSLPDTYRHLAEAGIEVDYTMGFHDAIGFRAGTAYPFRFYDLKSNEALNLRLQPCTVMDSALKQYLHLDAEQAESAMVELVENMKSTGGYFVSIWHNHSLSERDEWQGWRKVFKSMARNLSYCR